jgi:phospholipid/cholesterol/gamma-HCH transport system permease protein
MQTYHGFSIINPELSIPTVVSLSVTRELSPVLMALMFSAKIGSSLSARFGSMKATEQFDSMNMLFVSPVKFFFIPQILSSIIAVPFLVLLFDFLGLMSSYIISIYYLNLSSGSYLSNMVSVLSLQSINFRLIKGLCFGFAISSISCYFGYNTKSGANGVANCVVLSIGFSAIAILSLNSLLTYILL